MPPDITGWAQVHGLRGETNTLEKMQRRVDHDLAYIANQSLQLDLRILLLTVRAIWRDRNAYWGVIAEQPASLSDEYRCDAVP